MSVKVVCVSNIKIENLDFNLFITVWILLQVWYFPSKDAVVINSLRCQGGPSDGEKDIVAVTRRKYCLEVNTWQILVPNRQDWEIRDLLF